jgi:hypothetical protein
VKIVIAAMVRRSMMNRDDEGVKSKSSTTGPFSESVELTNPNNNLYLSDAEIEMLDADGFEPAEGDERLARLMVSFTMGETVVRQRRVDVTDPYNPARVVPGTWDTPDTANIENVAIAPSSTFLSADPTRSH